MVMVNIGDAENKGRDGVDDFERDRNHCSW